jgi:hypothetical protein
LLLNTTNINLAYYHSWSGIGEYYIKDPKTYNRSDVLIEAKEDTIEFKVQTSADTIGIIYKKQLVNETDWSLLVGLKDSN